MCSYLLCFSEVLRTNVFPLFTNEDPESQKGGWLAQDLQYAGPCTCGWACSFRPDGFLSKITRGSRPASRGAGGRAALLRNSQRLEVQRLGAPGSFREGRSSLSTSSHLRELRNPRSWGKGEKGVSGGCWGGKLPWQSAGRGQPLVPGVTSRVHLPSPPPNHFCHSSAFLVGGWVAPCPHLELQPPQPPFCCEMLSPRLWLQTPWPVQVLLTLSSFIWLQSWQGRGRDERLSWLNIHLLETIPGLWLYCALQRMFYENHHLEPFLALLLVTPTAKDRRGRAPLQRADLFWRMESCSQPHFWSPCPSHISVHTASSALRKVGTANQIYLSLLTQRRLSLLTTNWQILF